MEKPDTLKFDQKKNKAINQDRNLYHKTNVTGFIMELGKPMRGGVHWNEKLVAPLPESYIHKEKDGYIQKNPMKETHPIRPNQHKHHTL